MTIASQVSRITYTGNGSTVDFAIPFYFETNADIVVILRSPTGVETTQTIGTHYTLVGATLTAGGTCTFVIAPTSGYLITIYRDPQLTQTTSYSNNDPFAAKAHELALDKGLTIDQRTREMVSRSIHISDGEPTTTSTTLSPISTRSNRLLGFDATGALSYYVPSSNILTDPTLTGVANVGATPGFVAETATNVFTTRTITGTANEITFTFGNGVSGNPTASLPAALTFTGKTITGGTYTGAISFNGLSIATTTGSLTIANGKGFAANASLTLGGTDGTAITFQGTDVYVGRATTDTLTNKTFTGTNDLLTTFFGSNASTNGYIGVGGTLGSCLFGMIGAVGIVQNTGGSVIAMQVGGGGGANVTGAAFIATGTTGVGYGTGAGGTVTQATSKATGVTLNKVCGQITLNNAALAAATIVSFVFTNSLIAATDVLVLNHIGTGTVGGYTLNAQCTPGSATINIRNNTAGSLSEAIVLQFAIVKGVNA